MTLHSDLTALLADAGIVDVDVDEAVADEHVRSAAYQRIIAVAAGSQDRDGDRALVAKILRDPDELTSKTAVVALVDEIAAKVTDPAAFRRWAAEILPETAAFTAEGNREFVRQRVEDWLCYLSIEDGQTPTPAGLAAVSDWMQRLLADRSTSRPALALLAEHGRTKKIRNVAKNRASSGAGDPRTSPVRRPGR